MVTASTPTHGYQRAKRAALKVRSAIEPFRYRFTGEKDLQASIADVLATAGLTFTREARLGDGDIADFLVDGAEPETIACGVCVEVKVDGSLAEVTRQLYRYAEHSDVQALLLVTSLNRLVGVPRVIRDKPVGVLSLAEGAW